MTVSKELSERLIEAFDLRNKQGFVAAPIPGVSFFWATEAVECAPLVYDAGIVMVAQGDKIGFLADQTFRYDTDHYLVVSVPIAFSCATNATPDNPLLGIFVDIDLPVLHEMAAAISHFEPPWQIDGLGADLGVQPVAMDADMRRVSDRLLECICSERDSQIIGPMLVKEVLYRALLGKHGGALFGLTRQDAAYSRVARAIMKIRQEYATSLSVVDLAGEAHMSVSAFHRAFRSITGTSPLQFIKSMRLHRAKSLVVHSGKSVNEAAFAVGYESAGQFSREFKRLFGVSPSQAKATGYYQVIDWPSDRKKTR